MILMLVFLSCVFIAETRYEWCKYYPLLSLSRRWQTDHSKYTDFYQRFCWHVRASPFMKKIELCFDSRVQALFKRYIYVYIQWNICASFRYYHDNSDVLDDTELQKWADDVSSDGNPRASSRGLVCISTIIFYVYFTL